MQPILNDLVPVDDELHLWMESRGHSGIRKVHDDEIPIHAIQKMHRQIVHWGALTEALLEKGEAACANPSDAPDGADVGESRSPIFFEACASHLKGS